MYGDDSTGDEASMFGRIQNPLYLKGTPHQYFKIDIRHIIGD